MGVRIYTKVNIAEIRTHSYWAARKWCRDHIGQSNSAEAKNAGRSWYATRQWVYVSQDSYYGYGQVQEASFHFRNPAHATMFQLAWAK